MKFENIENLIVWQKARTLALETSTALGNIKDETLKECLRKSCIAIMNTIAQGYEKPSKKELIDDLYAAKVSCGSCRSMLHLALAFGFLNNEQHQKLIGASLDVTKLLAGFIKKLKEVKPAEPVPA
ncbi:MAG: four helix bundle protein [Candidatus Absconditabacterales bacterium]